MRFIQTNPIIHHMKVISNITLSALSIIVGFGLLLFTPAHATDGGRFSQVSFNDMITQTITIGHGNTDISQFNTMNRKIINDDNNQPNEVLIAQNEPVVSVGSTSVHIVNNDFKSSDFSNIRTAKSSLAVMHTLSEICPRLLDKDQLSAFHRGFDNKLTSMLPNVHNPKAAMRYLSTQQDYRRILSNMKAWQMSISDAENIAVCQDILNYR